MHSERTAEEQQKNTNKNVKNDNNQTARAREERDLEASNRDRPVNDQLRLMKSTIEHMESDDDDQRSVTERIEDATDIAQLVQIWMAYLRNQGKKVNVYTMDTLQHKMRGMGVERCKAAIRHSMENSWKKLVEPEPPADEYEEGVRSVAGGASVVTDPWAPEYRSN